jgi:hypothetical protein
MTAMQIARWAGVALAVLLLQPASADRAAIGIDPVRVDVRKAPPNECRVIDLELQPASLPDAAFPARPQIVAWIETPTGEHVDTIYIANATGRFGIGNRTGVFGMRSGPRWPYGARPDVFPVWAHRHGLSWPLIYFQNGDGAAGTPLDPDHNLSHPLEHSSIEVTFTRPLDPDEPQWDIGTAASPVNTDKGKQHATATSLYPPRADIEFTAGRDDPGVAMYRAMNPFDAVSQATPIADALFRYTWLIPDGFYDGTPRDYVMFVEVSRELDYNATYNGDTQPPVEAAGWNEYGVAYRGQPALVYRVPFTIGPNATRSSTAQYLGYSAPDGSDGMIRPPDATITDDPALPGVGARRLAHVFDPATGDTFQVRVSARFEVDEVAPAGAGSMAVVAVDAASADVAFTAPGDDEMMGRVAGYDIRVRTGEPVTLTNFGDSTRLFDTSPPVAGGDQQTLHLAGLVPLTHYYVGIRAYDSCHNYGPLEVVDVVTTDRLPGTVDWCFVATAAYGSAMAEDVTLLRRFRDAMLRSNVLGEVAVEAYYTFGPALAGVIAESELLRATAREALEPVVARARRLLGGE